VNIQFVVRNDLVYIIEVNPRASRTVPILSKVTKVPMVKIAMEVILGEKLKDLDYGIGLKPSTNLIAVKAPVFSFVKLDDVDAALTPEMKSTGEVLGIDTDYSKAMLKAFLGAGFSFPSSGKVLVTIADKAKDEVCTFVEQLLELGFEVLASRGTHHFLKLKNLQSSDVDISELSKIESMMKKGEIVMSINIPTKGKDVTRNGFKLRSLSEHLNIPNFTCLDTVKEYIKAMHTYRDNHSISYDTVDDYL
jgi:carbamoyl-phosphate synthase large subunit